MLTIILLVCLVVLVAYGIKTQLRNQYLENEVKTLEDKCAQLTAINIELTEKLPKPNKVAVAVSTSTQAVGTQVGNFFSGIKHAWQAFFGSFQKKTT